MRVRKEGEPAAAHDGVVTALVPRRGQGDRVAVYLDGRRAFDVSVLVADSAGLRAGAPLTADRQRDLLAQDAPYRARERALRLLGLRDRSRWEIQARLRQAGFGPEVVDRTVDWLQGLGYLDDRRFAAAYAEGKAGSGWGPRRIRTELAAKGVDRRVVDELLQTWEDEAAGREAGAEALELTVRRRFATQFATDPERAERRLAGFLARRGYDWDTIGRITRIMRGEASAGLPGDGAAADP
jgi:regulatory protein